MYLHIYVPSVVYIHQPPCDIPRLHRDSANAGLLEREVVRLVTPGTLSEPLDQQANYLLCLAPGPSPMLGLAWADVSTAEFKVE